ncbi:MAG: M28 family peptidase [Chloroflexi bacterium]|nr:M28 family peptidase [Chloroflexota bacterium]
MSGVKRFTLLGLIGVLLVTSAVWFYSQGSVFLDPIFRNLAPEGDPQPFDGERALEDVVFQVDLGPRTVGSEAHTRAVAWMVEEAEKAGWDVEVQETSRMNQPIRNVIARWGRGEPLVIIGAHYDSRLVADEDPDLANRNQPTPGANDGASGVAVLLELARVLPSHLENRAPGERPGEVWLVFFDAEDTGRLPGWDWILGSRAFVDELERDPQAVVIVDMIGDADLNIYQERNSDPDLTREIWETAAGLGYEEQFIPTLKYSILDDHTPFLEAGIPAVDLIDFDYPYWHTLGDTPDKVSAASLKAVGDTLIAWLTRSGQQTR